MRTNEERIAAVKSKVREMQQKKNASRARVIVAASMAACLAVILLLGTAMPGIISGFSKNGAIIPGTVASIFQSGNSLGYIIMGVLAFLLGIFFTMLCAKLHRHMMTQKDGSEKDASEDRNG